MKINNLSMLIHDALHLQAALRAHDRTCEDSALLAHLSVWLQVRSDEFNRATDARIEALLAGSNPATVYQGTNTLCAHCGQPAGDNPRPYTDEHDHVFLYCSDKCRDYTC